MFEQLPKGKRIERTVPLLVAEHRRTPISIESILSRLLFHDYRFPFVESEYSAQFTKNKLLDPSAYASLVQIDRKTISSSHVLVLRVPSAVSVSLCSAKLSKFLDKNLCRERRTGKVRVDSSYRDNRLRDSVSRGSDVAFFTSRSSSQNRPVRYDRGRKSITANVSLSLSLDFEILVSARVARVNHKRSIDFAERSLRALRPDEVIILVGAAGCQLTWPS